jgi:WD40 repeat protein
MAACLRLAGLASLPLLGFLLMGCSGGSSQPGSTSSSGRSVTKQTSPGGGPISAQASEKSSTASDEIRRFQHPDTANAVSVAVYSPDGKKGLSGSADGILRLWDLESGNLLGSCPGSTIGIFDLAFLPDGRALACGDTKAIRLCDLAAGKEIKSLTGFSGNVNCLAVSADGSRALSGSGKMIYTWDLSSGKESGRSDTLPSVVDTVAFLPGDRALVGTSRDGLVYVTELKMPPTPGRQLKAPARSSGRALAATADGKRALIGSSDGMLSLWDLEKGQEILHWPSNQQFVLSVAVTADGSRALSGGADKTIRLWDVDAGKELHSFTGHTGAVSSVAFAPDGKRALSTGREDRTMRLWRLP